MLDYKKTKTYDYDLPSALIATHPSAKRSASKLLVLPGNTDQFEHESFVGIRKYLKKGDLLVFNNTRVVQARLYAKKETGGAVELFVLAPISPTNWSEPPSEGKLVFRCMTRSSKTLKVGILFIENYGEIQIDTISPGSCTVRLDYDNSLESFLEHFGQMPLPPYIIKKRKEEKSPSYEAEDEYRYQTVFAKHPGAVAAPTAGLHFDEALLETLGTQGIEFAHLTLHVGIGTFKPVTCEDLDDHPMHSEKYEISPDLKEKIAHTKKRGGRVIAVGTTSARALEAEGRKADAFQAGAFDTDIFITPGFEWKICDGLLTNFHLPKSTLLALVFSLGGPEKIMEAYRVAIENDYRFYSYGDAMLIL